MDATFKDYLYTDPEKAKYVRETREAMFAEQKRQRAAEAAAKLADKAKDVHCCDNEEGCTNDPQQAGADEPVQPEDLSQTLTRLHRETITELRFLSMVGFIIAGLSLIRQS